MHPVLIEQLSLRILDPVCCTVSTPRYPFAAVEVSAPAGFEDAFGLADEIMVVSAPLEVRRERAIHRGMEHPILMLAVLASPISLRFAV